MPLSESRLVWSLALTHTSRPPRRFHLSFQSNLPTYDTCFHNWLDSQSNDDLRQAIHEDVGEMIRNRVRVEIDRRDFEPRNLVIIPVSFSQRES